MTRSTHLPIDDPRYDHFMRSAGSVLRDARQRAGLSQSELARRADVSQPVISAYENDHRDPSLATLTKLVEATGHQIQLNLSPQPGAIRGLPDTPIGRLLRRRRRAVIDLAARRGMSNVWVFGSVARGTDNDDSDIDLLVDTDAHVSVLSLVGLARELRELLGRDVDIVPAAGLKPGVADEAHAQAVPL